MVQSEASRMKAVAHSHAGLVQCSQAAIKLLAFMGGVMCIFFFFLGKHVLSSCVEFANCEVSQAA